MRARPTRTSLPAPALTPIPRTPHAGHSRQRSRALPRRQRSSLPRRAVRLPAHSERERSIRIRRGHAARRAVGVGQHARRRPGHRDHAHRRTPGRPRRVAQGARGRAHGSRLRPLRCPARRAARSVDHAAVRAHDARRPHLRARLRRRQGTALRAHEGARGPPQDARQAPRQHRRARRGRRGGRQRQPRGVRQRAGEAARVRLRRRLRLVDVRAGAAVHSVVTARACLLPDRSRGAHERSALRQLRRRRGESGDGTRAHPRDLLRCERSHRHPRLLRQGARVGSEGARCARRAPLRRENLSQGSRRPGTRRREGLHDSRAALGAPNVRGERPAQRLHGRGLENSAARRRRWRK